MEYTDLQQKLNKAFERYDSQTFLGSYRETVRSSLLKDGLSTRANSLWKMAECVVAKKDDGSPDGAASGYLDGWKTLASGNNNQYLVLEVSDGVWEIYDAQGGKLGGEDFIRDFLDKRKRLKKPTEKRVLDGASSLQLITYGAPGTGKSHRVDALTNEMNSIRVTFHPDTDYSMFVGSYKPTMTAQERYALDATGKTHKIDAKEKDISYSFVPQAFLKAYVEAWRRWCDAALPDEEKRCYLVIEEINRGNCAQIFGDMFQLLDRCESGWSCYAVAPDDDIQCFLREDEKYGLGGLAWTDNVVNDEGKTVAAAEQVKTGARMVLPPNLCILATMNTSDQSLFPIDSAFKRRWDWEYVPITEGRDKDGEPLGWKIRPVEKTEDIAEGTPEYDWWDFVRGVNARISAATRSEDKKIGYFFVKPEALDGKKVVTAKKILSKVIFYLWNDVFKDIGFARIFSRNGKGVEFNEFYGADGKMNVDLVREFVETMVGKTDATPAQQG